MSTKHLSGINSVEFIDEYKFFLTMITSIGGLLANHFSILQINVCKYIAFSSHLTKEYYSAAVVLFTTRYFDFGPW